MSQESQGRPSKNERRLQAREQAKQAREQQQKKEKRNRTFLQGGVVLAVVAVIAVVGLVISQSMKPEGPGPANMASGGVVVGADLKVVETPALQGDDDLIPTAVDRTQVPLDIRVYLDYMCPYCGQFEQANGTILENWVGSGEATLELYPMNSLDGNSLGTRYSTRAANALACAANYQPDAVWNLNAQLLSADVQPAGNTAGLSDKELLEQLSIAGAEVNSELRACVTDREFAKRIDKNTLLAQTEVPANLAEGVEETLPVITGTPTVLVNGQIAPLEPAQLEAFLLKTMSDVTGTSTGSAVSEPTPTPTN